MRLGVPPRALRILPAAALLVLSERLVSVASGGRLWMSPGGLGFFFCGAVALSAVAALVVGLSERVGRRVQATALPARAHVAAAASIGALIGFPAGRATGQALVSGAWVSQQSWAPAFSWAVTLGLTGAGAGVLGLHYLSRASRVEGEASPPSRFTRGVAIAWLGLMLASLVADAQVMVGLHREFHLVMLGLAVLTAFLCVDSLPPWTRVEDSAVAKGVALLLVVASVPACLMMGEGPRRDLVLRSNAAAALIRTLVPSAPSGILHAELERLPTTPPPGVDAPTFDSVDLVAPDGKPWNVLLVVVDTLRADALPPTRRANRRSANKSDSPFLNRWLGRTFRFHLNYAQATRTNRSMPAMFRSLHPHEHPHYNGQPLGEAMANLGMTPIAVVPNILFEGRESRNKELLEGFEYVDTYDKLDQDSQFERTRSLLSKVKDRQFFAWVHFYAMHAPGYDGESLSKKDGSARKRYRRSLKWTDAQMKKLIAELKAQGVSQHTVVIFVADHGEALGANGVGSHGPTVYEEEIRTPMAIHIPGQPGHVIKKLVGNVDVVPTVFDLLGFEPDPRHRGHSLLPMMLDRQLEKAWDYAYYMENDKGSIVAAAHGQTKLIYDSEAGVFHRYEVEKDPKEKDNLFTGEDPLDFEMQRRLMHLNPGLFASELESDATLALLQQRVAEQEALGPSPQLSFLLALVAKAKDDATQAIGARLFKRTQSDELRLEILRHLRRRDPKAWDARVESHLEELAGSPEELRFVDALARQDQGPLSSDFVATRVSELANEGDFARVAPWLRLIRNWKDNDPEALGSPLATLLETALARSQTQPEELSLILSTLASFKRQPEALPEGLSKRVAGLLEHPELIVQVWAVRALARVATASEVPALEQALRHGEIVTRQEALMALGWAQGEAAIPLIVAEAKKELLFTVQTVRLLHRLKSKDGIPYLEWVEANHYNAHVQRRARRANNAARKQHGMPLLPEIEKTAKKATKKPTKPAKKTK